MTDFGSCDNAAKLCACVVHILSWHVKVLSGALYLAAVNSIHWTSFKALIEFVFALYDAQCGDSGEAGRAKTRNVMPPCQSLRVNI